MTTSKIYHPQCNVSYGSITGGYAEPFSYSGLVYETAASGNRLGYITQNFDEESPSPKRHVVQISCPPDSPSSLPHDFTETYKLFKVQEFECPKGYYVKRGPSSSFAADDEASIKLPNLCESRKTATITVETQQIASCGTLHPCHPATGDKSRAEVDFVFAGRPFTRYYHSLGQVWGLSRIGIN